MGVRVRKSRNNFVLRTNFYITCDAFLYMLPFIFVDKLPYAVLFCSSEGGRSQSVLLHTWASSKMGVSYSTSE